MWSRRWCITGSIGPSPVARSGWRPAGATMISIIMRTTVWPSARSAPSGTACSVLSRAVGRCFTASLGKLPARQIASHLVSPAQSRHRSSSRQSGFGGLRPRSSARLAGVHGCSGLPGSTTAMAAGMYFEDTNGHCLEIHTRPCGRCRGRAGLRVAVRSSASRGFRAYPRRVR